MSELVALTDTPSLAQLLERATLEQLCRSAQQTFAIELSIASSDGALSVSGARVGDEACEEVSRAIVYDQHELGTLTLRRRAGGSIALGALASHFTATIEGLLHSGHRAFLASKLHIATAEANYHELATRNEQLQLAYDKLKELDRLKSTFLATMSHELRTPLTSIIGYSEMLASGMGGDLNETQQEFVDTIRAKGDHLLELIMTLLDVARLEQDQLRLHRGPTEAGKLAHDALRTVSPAAAKKGIRLETRIEADLPPLYADEARLRQVLLNLLDNAVKFTPSGGAVQLEVVATTLADPDSDGAGLVLLEAPGRAVEFRVRDTGIGIPDRELERIFDAFYQVDGSATREHGGTGLGLSIVKRLVEAHQGSLEVHSREGEGSEFRVRIAAVDPGAASVHPIG
jgi:two-component system, NarL family, sensor histidine kinase BarA